jgi:CRP-like cAMP-binding protein
MLALDHVIGNHLLEMLDGPDLERLRPSLKEVPLTPIHVLETPGRPIGHVYFVETGLLSVVAMLRRNRRIEVGMIGKEGMTGLATILHDDRSMNETVVQRAGTALRLSTVDLRSAMISSEAFRTCLLRFVHAFLAQAAQTSLANGCAKLEERVARWILMSHDRFAGSDLRVTHDLLALMLGVRRPGITLVLQTLEGKRLIRSTRGLISVTDREGLRRQANGSYGVSEAEYARIFDG